MTKQEFLIEQRMVVVPLPAALRVKSESWQFPTLTVYSESLVLLGQTLPLPIVEDLRLEGGAIKFRVGDKAYSYAAQGYWTKESPDLEITKRLFNLIAALKAKDQQQVDTALKAFKSSRHTSALIMAGVAVAAIIILILRAFLSEFAGK